ncbi:hypothetical protein DDE05_00475 [Streptomyces cavourensis]|nr:hypothetical protein DDE05_00475 [Streptomyces cavourensis]
MMSRWLLPLFLVLTVVGCSDRPKAVWLATEAVTVYSDANGDLLRPIFTVLPGEVCALSESWTYEKDFRHKSVECSRGRGWITSDSEFKKAPDHED